MIFFIFDFKLRVRAGWVFHTQTKGEYLSHDLNA